MDEYPVFGETRSLPNSRRVSGLAPTLLRPPQGGGSGLVPYCGEVQEAAEYS